MKCDEMDAVIKYLYTTDVLVDSERDALSLAEFNRLHREQIQRAVRAAAERRRSRLVDRCFDGAVLILWTGASFVSAYELLMLGVR